MNKFADISLSTTRVKKYKSYRLEIKKDYEAYSKKIEEKDELKLIEKKIKKIDPNLIIKNKELDFFMDVIVNEVNDHGYIKEAIYLITSIKNNNKFQEILEKTENLEIDSTTHDPSFDKKGNITSEWLKSSDVYNKLLEIKKWHNFSADNFQQIKLNIQENLFRFKDALYNTQNPNFVKNAFPKKIMTTKLWKNKNNKKVFFVLVTCFLVSMLAVIIFLILFLTGV
ncbi:hypothetical protein [Malacoplasma iowae]|uniref:hypothetical protein n=1 Tax=Malacoplasma iowae TaxID=2116 RepID=UPI0038733BB6|nr:hypothetical protein QX179_00980 [Malacoplasma iowae]